MPEFFMRTVSRLGAVGLGLALIGGVAARPLEAIGQRGTLTVCAHPNALPFASKGGEPHGFQIDLAEALAQRIGVSLTRNWVINSFQYRRADCDIILDAIADKGALAEVGLRMSRPYHRSGVVLAVRKDSSAASLASFEPGQRVGVQVGSIASMAIAKRGIATTPFVFEDDILAALARGEIAAGAVTPASIGWFNLQHPGEPLRRISAFADNPELNWNVAVGMVGGDEPLGKSIDQALEAMRSDGTIARIYARYGVELLPPQ
jgi:polar amino acid transport system substrate-binding protein